MDAAEVAAKVRALEAKLAGTFPRIADLEARVSLLEAENTRWRRAVPRGETFGRLEEGLSGSKQETSLKVGDGVGAEEGMAADVSNTRSADAGPLALSTPRKRAVRAVTGGSNDEDEIDDAGGGGDGGDQGSVHCDGNEGLDDDDVLITPCGKKRSRVITSDSEDEGEDSKDGELQEGVGTPRKRAFRLVSDSDNEDNSEGVHVVSMQHASCGAETKIEVDDEDDNIPIREVVKKMREERMHLNDGELGVAEGRSMPTTRRSKKARVAHTIRDLVKDDLEEDDGMDDADSFEKSAEPEDSDIEMDYTLLKDVTQESHRWRVRVRITRISHYIGQLNFVMLDDQGGIMEGKVLAWLAPRFLRLIREDVVYYIHNFEVVNPSPTYRAVNHPCMATFTSHTKISKDTDVPDSFPMYAYKLSSYEVLRSRENSTVLMSDAIGLMMGLSHVKTVTAKGAPTAVRNVYISNGRETALVNLWGAHAHQFPAEAVQQQMQQGPVVILFVALTVKLYEGKLSLQGSKVCRWYLNAPIPEVAALQNSSAGVSHEVK